MSFKKPFQKTKNIILKTLKTLKNYLFRGYNKIPKTLFLNPLTCSKICKRNYHLDDHFHLQFSHQSVLNHDQNNADQSMPLNEVVKDHKTDANHHHKIKINSKKRISTARRKVGQSSFSSYKSMNNGTYVVARKIKELEKLNLGDVDQCLDVEEALHYYSRLTCPVYVDIVNKFFMEMYAEFVIPQHSISISTSSSHLTL